MGSVSKQVGTCIRPVFIDMFLGSAVSVSKQVRNQNSVHRYVSR